MPIEYDYLANYRGISGLPCAFNHWSCVAGPDQNSHLPTKDVRNLWEVEVSNGIITPKLKVKQKHTAFHFVSSDKCKISPLVSKYNILSFVAFPIPALGSTAQGNQHIHPGRLPHLRQPRHEALVWGPSSLLGSAPTGISDPQYVIVELQGEGFSAQPHALCGTAWRKRQSACAVEISA